jgi:hypothetical protein
MFSPGHGMPMSFFPFGPFMWLVFSIVIVVPFWAIFSKAGYSSWLSLLMAIPLVNVITLYVLAFSRWPSQRKT